MSTGYPSGRDQRGRVHQPVAPCRDCRQPILWATTPRGARFALDVEALHTVPDPPARVYLVLEGPHDWRLVVELHDRELAREALDLHGTLYSAHFDTCPKVDRADRPRPRADLA
jgi:hypothetical protein